MPNAGGRYFGMSPGPEPAPEKNLPSDYRDTDRYHVNNSPIARMIRLSHLLRCIPRATTLSLLFRKGLGYVMLFAVYTFSYYESLLDLYFLHDSILFEKKARQIYAKTPNFHANANKLSDKEVMW